MLIERLAPPAARPATRARPRVGQAIEHIADGHYFPLCAIRFSIHTFTVSD
jgi:hypothetical protein